MKKMMIVTAAALALGACSTTQEAPRVGMTQPADDRLAVVAIENKDWRTAESQLRQTLASEQQDAFAMLNLAYVLSQQGEDEEALVLYREVLNLQANPRAARADGQPNKAKTIAERGILALAQN